MPRTLNGWKPTMNDHELMESLKNALNSEWQAIRNFSDQVGQPFVDAVRFIHHCRGKILLSGIGKSGIIAQKIAATFNSIGKVSIFIHPVEAIHGDLGIIHSDDLLIVLSKSGKTEELFSLLNFVRKKGVPIVAIVGVDHSAIQTLATHSIIYHIEQEACPLHVAPTTSTTLSLAIGDAIAAGLVLLMQLKIEDFALNHPGGTIGKAYYLKVSDVMHSGPDNPQLLETAGMDEVIETITQKRMGAVNIVNHRGQLLGIITDGDLRRALKNKYAFFTLTAHDVMTPNPIFVHDNDLAIHAIDLIENRPSQIPVLPVLDENNINIGIIRIHDLVKAGL